MSTLPLINDPEAIAKLLESIKASDAWQQLANTESDPSTTTASSSSSTAAEAPWTDSGHSRGTTELESILSEGPVNDDEQISAQSVASLLSQLNPTPPSNLPPSSAALSHRVTASNYPSSGSHEGSAPAIADSPHARSDVRALSFQQALPHLARLGEDQAFVATISKMKLEQAELEKRLWEERCNIQQGHEQKVEMEIKKAKITGGLTKFQADMMTAAFRNELQRFDRERALSTWDGLIAKQQGILESLGVPAMFVTSVTGDRKKQQRVMQVLTGMVDGT